ncbi:RIP metalloprotease RseP [Mesobacterium pallidum]|uniref:RIP metalloprotease RseP n=1 Tax=Mesobacterium pallidum TaxID=2872037 RepID=UPI001EE33EAF|nr:RIP metalloprotease RseP [Mesobacterium pallidum]
MLIPEFGGFLWTILAFVVALSVIVAIHEYGHYIVGRWSGIKADVFSLGFGPVLLSRTDRHGTRWQLAALPFGGYVKFAGDSNAASGKDAEAMEGLSDDERRHTMHGAPLWARAATVAAGPVFNFILSIAIFAGVIWSEGVATDPLSVGEMVPLPVEHDLREGDILLEIGGMPVPGIDSAGGFQAILDALPLAPTVPYLVGREGDAMRIEGPYPFPPLVEQLSPKSAAYDIGMEVGDVITEVDGMPIVAFSQLKEIVETSDGAPLLIKVWRDGEQLDFALTPRSRDEPQSDGTFTNNWRIGIAGGLVFEPATEAPGVGFALSTGVNQVLRIVEGSVSGIWHIVTGAISTCNLSGPVGIAQASGTMASQGTTSFIWFIAVLSTAVGLLNLFPIPVLDGGHLMFHAYEAVTGRPPSDRALRVMMTLGLALILTLTVFALGSDLFCT